jgi:hypothetical protein
MATSTWFLALGALLVAVIGGYGLHELWRSYRIYAREPDDVMDAPSGGRIELEGTARPAAGTIQGAFTGEESLLCEYAVEEYRSSGKSSSWQTIDEDTIAVPFLVDDGTGTVLVEPAGVRTNLSRDARIEVDGGAEPPARIRRFIEGNPDVDSENTSVDLKVIELNTGNKRRYVERRLDPGETMHVLGHARYGRDGLEYAGSVNALVGPRLDADEDRSWVARLQDRVAGREFVVSDADERGAAWRIAKPGLVALFIAALGVGVVALLLV